MTEDLLHEIREGGIAWTTFNRPQARNAMTFAMYARLAELADEISADPAIRVWVIMGAGGKAFASGTDISQFREPRIHGEGHGIARLRAVESGPGNAAFADFVQQIFGHGQVPRLWDAHG